MPLSPTASNQAKATGGHKIDVSQLIAYKLVVYSKEAFVRNIQMLFAELEHLHLKQDETISGKILKENSKINSTW